MSYARDVIAGIAGYVPGEQPGDKPFIKLNTNENPYPPAAGLGEVLRSFPYERLRLYSEPSARMVREAASAVYGIAAEQILCGNGSDDLLTIALRTFVDQGGTLAYTEPSYSLYPVLADLQGAIRRPVPLDEHFELPENASELAGAAKLFLLARPNAPTGNSFPIERVERLCRAFSGVVWIDEAYADFAEDHCLSLVAKYPNVVVSRTFSKSYSLAGLRLGLAFAPLALIQEMEKVKDSYNVDMLTQYLGKAALEAHALMLANAERIKATRQWTMEQLEALGCRVLPSQANFLFVRPVRPAAEVFAVLREHGYLVRFFNLPRISEFIRVTIGRQEDMAGFIACMAQINR
ncbi:MAG: histidinol-phosphate transaminase [Lentisphaeria bacterium]|nr:histidinol-phosphate transaminase [Lentisphaeria bacterium]